jgi:hypothetical protein
MSVWIVLAVLGLLLMMGLLREGFDATESIKGPPYNNAEKQRIYGMANTSDQKILLDKAIAENPTKNPNTPADKTFLEAAAGGYIAPAVGEFFTSVFRPATTPITNERVVTFMTTRTGPMKTIEEDVLKRYFVGQQGVGTSVRSGYAAVLSGLGQGAGYLRDSVPGAATTGTTTPPATGTTTPPATGTTPPATGTTTPPATGTTPPATGTTTPPATGTTTPPTGTTPPTTGTTPVGNTTGGSSASTYVPSGGSVENKNVWGPAWSGAAESTGTRRGQDSTTTTIYPVLMGGYGGSAGTRERTRIDGVGITNASGGGITLPPVTTTGSEPNSQFLPNARVPNASDFSRDPYRLARTYSAATHSSKTDPVPFLTDFSAFFK